MEDITCDENENNNNNNENNKYNNYIKNIENVNYFSINQKYFNSNFIYYDIHGNRSNQFIGITYKTPTIFLDGLMFETPWMKTIKPIEISSNENRYWDENRKSKFFLEQTFIETEENKEELRNFYNCITSIDEHTINFLVKQHHNYNNTPYFDAESCVDNSCLDSNSNSKANKYSNKSEYQYSSDYRDIYCNNINKYSFTSKSSKNIEILRNSGIVSSSYKTPFEMKMKAPIENKRWEDDSTVFNNTITNYQYIKTKISNNIKSITYNNKPYTGKLQDLDVENSLVKSWIICYGLWKYNNKIGMSWSVVKMAIKKDENDIYNYIRNPINRNIGFNRSYNNNSYNNNSYNNNSYNKSVDNKSIVDNKSVVDSNIKFTNNTYISDNDNNDDDDELTFEMDEEPLPNFELENDPDMLDY